MSKKVSTKSKHGNHVLGTRHNKKIKHINHNHATNNPNILINRKEKQTKIYN